MELLQFETDEEILARAKDECIVCDRPLEDCSSKKKRIERVRARGNWCAKCNNKASKIALESKFKGAPRK